MYVNVDGNVTVVNAEQSMNVLTPSDVICNSSR